MKNILLSVLLIWSATEVYSQCSVDAVNPDLLNQTVCEGESIIPIIINITGSFNVDGLSGTGLQTSFSQNNSQLTIFGTPTVDLINYTVSCSWIGFTGPSGTSVSGTITRVPLPTVDQPSNIFECGGTQVTVIFSGSNATSYSWTNSNTSIGLGSSGSGNINFVASNVNGTQTATITVTPSNTSCSGSPKTFTITIYPSPDISGNNWVCEGNQEQLTGSGMPAQSNPWTSSNPDVATVDNNGLVTGNVPGTVIITYTALNGCFDQIGFTVYPKAYAGIDQNILCWHLEYAYMAASGTGQWELLTTDPPGLNLNIIDPNDPNTGVNNFSGPGTYILRWTNEFGCFDEAIITAQDICPCENPPEIILSIDEKSVCGAQAITVDSNIFLNASTLSFFHNGSGTLEHLVFPGNSFMFTYTPTPSDFGKTIQITIVTDDNDGSGPCEPATAIFFLHIDGNPEVGPDIQVDCASRDSAIISATSGEGLWILIDTDPPGMTLDIVDPSNVKTTIKNFSGTGYYTLIRQLTSGCSDTLTVEAKNDCDCTAQPDLNLSATSFTTCDLKTISVPNNTYFNATTVLVSHNGSGNASVTHTSSNTFTFSYTPTQADTGKTITLTLYTDDPDMNGPCYADTMKFVLQYHLIPHVSSDVAEVCTKSGGVILSASGSGNWNLVSTTPAGLTVSISEPTSANTLVTSFSGPGSYILRWTTSEGCANDLAITAVDCPCAPDIVLLTEGAYCGQNNGLIHVKVSNATYPYSCSLSGAKNKTIDHVSTDTVIFDHLGPGTYKVSVIDAAGCQSASVTQVHDAGNTLSLILGSVKHSFCGDHNGSFSAYVTGGRPPYTFTVNGSMVSYPVSMDNLSAGSYMLSVVDNAGCTKDTTITLLESNPFTANLTDSGFDCNSATGIISVTAEGGRPPYAYALNHGVYGENPVFTGLTPDVYTISVVDVDLCYTELTITPFIKADFSAVDDYLQWHFQYNPLIIDVISNDSITNPADYSVRPLSEIITDDDGNEIGKLFNREVGDQRMEFYFDGARQNLYPELIKMPYLLCETDCPVKCDTGIIYLLQKVPCTDDNGGFVNTITPNGDGRNDVLIIPNFPKCNVTRMAIRIFNRWGNAVYENSEYGNEWDGKNNDGSPLPEGTYYYVLSLKTNDGKDYVIKNFVEIIR